MSKPVSTKHKSPLRRKSKISASKKDLRSGSSVEKRATTPPVSSKPRRHRQAGAQPIHSAFTANPKKRNFSPHPKKKTRPATKDNPGSIPQQDSYQQTRFKKRNFSPHPKKKTRPTAKDNTGSIPQQDSYQQTRFKKRNFSPHPKKKTRPTVKDNPGSISQQDPHQQIRLNKYIAHSGMGSRRYADKLIASGLVTVNGNLITEMGFKINKTDTVYCNGKKIHPEPFVYVLLNKPKGFITTTHDPSGRDTVMSLISKACSQRIYPVGRLDRNTTGLLLLTNDGHLAEKLTHPSYQVKKIYKIQLDRPLAPNDFKRITNGITLPEGPVPIDRIARIGDDGKTLGLELHIGWNRIVRRIFETLHYTVTRLDRVVYAGIDKKNLGRGNWRFLSASEVRRLKHLR